MGHLQDGVGEELDLSLVFRGRWKDNDLLRNCVHSGYCMVGLEPTGRPVAQFVGSLDLFASRRMAYRRGLLEAGFSSLPCWQH